MLVPPGMHTEDDARADVGPQPYRLSGRSARGRRYDPAVMRTRHVAGTGEPGARGEDKEPGRA